MHVSLEFGFIRKFNKYSSVELANTVKNVNYKKVFLARNSTLHIKISKANQHI
ncbi:hypothetical protein HNP67_001216 [Borreliella californiensis]|uniref:Uncharacterized protein n=1 Tax=Borreliella californiensis TaxID=373543 RepID=A0A7X0DQ08_9SPIR|nr:hypothetical protein [Borreliella californiensis]